MSKRIIKPKSAVSKNGTSNFEFRTMFAEYLIWNKLVDIDPMPIVFGVKIR